MADDVVVGEGWTKTGGVYGYRLYEPRCLYVVTDYPGLLYVNIGISEYGPLHTIYFSSELQWRMLVSLPAKDAFELMRNRLKELHLV